jgi:hypothetical protein
MQRIPRTIESLANEVLDGANLWIERVRIHAAARQGGEHRITAQQGDFALAGITAEQYRHLAEIRGGAGAPLLCIQSEEAHAGTPTMRTSV